MNLFPLNGFNRINPKEAIDFLKPRHYSGRDPNVMYSFGYYQNGNIVACCTFGKPASHSLCIGVCGDNYSKYVIELNRLCVDELHEITLSRFVSLCLKNIENKIVVSYADTEMNHNGYIYQATNFIYTGCTKERTDKYSEGNKHSRHYDKNISNEVRKVRSSKHRYIYITGSKKFKKQALSKLNYKIMEYPKGNNKRYSLGDYIKPRLVYGS